jgi:hypothetical protein
MNPHKHDFFQHMASLRQAIARDYEVVTKRSKEDPGTAGDQAEEQWAEILRNWLPATFPVITKGRILFEDRSASPQVDVLVLKPSYPLALRKQKHIFSGGVLAAFECKLTLRGRDVRDAFEACSLIKKKSRRVQGTPFDELCKLPLFGVLAHSHNIRAKKGESRLYEAIEKCQTEFAQHNSELIDVICVAEEATIPLSRHLLIGPNLNRDERKELADEETQGLISTMYVIHQEKDGDPLYVGAALAGLVHDLTQRLAFHEPSIRDWADHLSYLGFYGGIGRPVYWTADELSAPVLRRLQKRGSEDEPWSKWSKYLP